MARGQARLVGVGTGYGAGALAMSIGALPASPTAWQVGVAIVAAMLAATVALGASRPRRRGWVLAGPPVAAAAAVLFDATPPGVSTIVLAVLAGAGAGVAARRPWALAGAAAGVATVVVARVAVSSSWALAAAALTTVVAAAASLLAPAERRDDRRRRRNGWLVPVGALVTSLALVAWTGANDPQLSWFGPVVWHGPRDRDTVAITFDDGPNATATLAVRDVLDRYGVKATFFLVGSALDARPDIAQALLDDGMLLGGHSYDHDQWRWLDPRYPELERSVAAFQRRLGICPHWYRPPHGQRTPFMIREAHDRDVEMVTWDVSAGDWATDDPELIARRVLRDVQPGSIVLLHDGLDGHVDADRSVVVAALPIILDGLQERGLRPVTVAELVGGPAYDDSC